MPSLADRHVLPHGSPVVREAMMPVHNVPLTVDQFANAIDYSLSGIDLFTANPKQKRDALQMAQNSEASGSWLRSAWT
jgi:hypothetical protein